MEEKIRKIDNLDNVSRRELILHAVLLLRTINKNESKEEDISFFEMLTNEELIEYIVNFYDSVVKETESEIDWMESDDYYTPSSTCGDYSPSCPWNAPGMSVRDFI